MCYVRSGHVWFLISDDMWDAEASREEGLWILRATFLKSDKGGSRSET